MSGSGALQLRLQCVWRTEQHILNIIESLQRPGLQGFEMWYSWWKLCWKLGGKCFKCFKSLSWNGSGFIRSLKHFHGNQRKRPWTEIKASKRITEPHQEQNFKIHFIKLISISKIILIWMKPDLNLTYNFSRKCSNFLSWWKKAEGKEGRSERNMYCIIGLQLKGSKCRSKHIRCFNESDVMKGEAFSKTYIF